VYGQGTFGSRIISQIPPSESTEILGEDLESTLIGYFGRLNYNYNSRYLFSATLRRDASSTFSKDQREGYFPSISGAWNVSNEKFWNSEVVNYLKFRVSYGELGSFSQDRFTEAIFSSNVSNVSFNSASAPGFTRLSLVDSERTWETTKTFNLGVDVSLFESSINLGLDYFTKDITDVLVDINLPSTTGVELPTTRNAGTLENDGLEVSLNYNKSDGDFKFKVDTNFSFTLKSQAGDIPNPILGPGIDEDLRVVNRTLSNQPIGAFYGFIVEDKVNPETGDFVRRDISRDGTIDNDDITVIGDPVPDFTYGLNFTGNYKNFDLALNFVGVQGNEIYNLSRYFNIFWQDGGKLTDVLNAWTPNNRDTNIPRATVADEQGNQAPSSFFVEDGSYFRLKTLEIGYNFKEALSKANVKFVQDMRLSFNIQNLFVLTKYSGYDPDVASANGGRANLNSGVPGFRNEVNPLLSRGLDARAYPNARTFTMGLQLTF